MKTLLLLQASQDGFEVLRLLTSVVTGHKGSIHLISSLASLFFGIVMFAPFRRGATETWARYFGAGFFVTSAQYAIRLIIHIIINYKMIGSNQHENARFIEHVLVALCSAGNNLFFIAAALELARIKSKSLLLSIALVVAIISLASLFDVTAWKSEASLSNIPQETQNYYRLLSFPDMLLSIVGLTLIGYVTATYVFYRQLPFLSTIAIVVGVLYGLIHVIYGFNPIIFDSPYFNHYVPVKSFFGTRETLNAFLFAVAFPLKFGLFLPGYYLHQRSMTAFYDVQGMLDSVVDGRDEFISYNGIVKVIGHRFRADVVDLSIRLPGKKRERIGSIVWRSTPPKSSSEKLLVVRDLKSRNTINSNQRRLSSENKRADESNQAFTEAVIEWGLGRDKPYIYPERRSVILNKLQKIYEKTRFRSGRTRQQEIHETSVPEAVKAELQGKKAMLLIPVKFHGATVGCIKVERNKPSYIFGKRIKLYLPFSNSALNLGTQIADLAAPSIQAHRELATLDKLSLEFAQALSEATAKKAGELQDFHQAVDVLANVLHDTLAPEAMRMVVDFGFSSIPPADRGNPEYVKLMDEKIRDRDYDDLPQGMEDAKGNVFRLYKRELVMRVSEIDETSLSPQTEQARTQDKQFRIGYLVLAVRQPRDKFDRPMLGANYLHRKAVASIVADAILDFARAYLSRRLRKLSTKLNQEGQLDSHKWFTDIEHSAVTSGLLWIVTNQQDGALMGSEKGKEIVRALEAGTDPKIDVVPPKEVHIRPYKLNPPRGETRHVIRLDLPNSDYRLWLGVNRADFEKELYFASPWQTFLKTFGEIAEAGLIRFTAAQEFQKLQIEAAQYQGLATVAVTMGTLTHQLTNMARNQAAACAALLDLFNVGALTIVQDKKLKLTAMKVGDLIRSMKESADHHMHLLEVFAEISKVDDRRPCRLVDAVHQAKLLFQTALLQNEIEVIVNVDENYKIHVPFYVASLALGNLISNAKDAMDNGKKITINAYEKDGGINCEVKDEGKGIDPKLQPVIFNLGVTSKPHSGGWGLYLVKRSLLENGANIELTDAGQNGTGTTFTIWFPTPPESHRLLD